ncbi:hypothetical protein CsatB_007409 [Cannabis sativa]|uniref:uncharacterized protein LOC115723469 n=1 Tax=Cannabis sativa TaxID=3483 RepID=UPI0011E01C64|nr:uncharacterized protein LOC115723469 [Cannabis sativa]
MVNKMFKNVLRKNMKVYVDDMLVKSKSMSNHEDLKDAFSIIWELSYRGIEANLEKIKALLDIPSPRKHKNVHKLAGRIIALSRFVSKSIDKCIPFFNVLRENNKFEWTIECPLSRFEKLKEHLTKALILSKSIKGESLFLYLSLSDHAISAALVREEENVQLPVYYMSKRLLGVECKYPMIKNLSFCLLIDSWKLRPYFQVDAIKVLTNHPLCQVLQKLESSGRLLKCAMELSQFDIHYQPRISIKGRALVDFIVECTGINDDPEMPILKLEVWKIYVDRALNEKGSGAGINLISSQQLQLQSALQFEFEASNNEAEHEAMIAGLQLAKEVGAKNIELCSDSQVVVNQVSGEYQTKEEKMASYVAKPRELLKHFKHYSMK